MALGLFLLLCLHDIETVLRRNRILPHVTYYWVYIVHLLRFAPGEGMLFYCHKPPGISQQGWVLCKWHSKTSRPVLNPLQEDLYWKTDLIIKSCEHDLENSVNGVSNLYVFRLLGQDNSMWQQWQRRNLRLQGGNVAWLWSLIFHLAAVWLWQTHPKEIANESHPSIILFPEGKWNLW